MKKILILFVLLFLITGCEATYNLSINNLGLNEELLVGTDTSSEVIETYDGNSLVNLLNKYNNDYISVYYDDTNPYYKVDNYQTNNIYGLKLNHNFRITDYYRSSMVKKAFKEFNIAVNNDIITMKTSDKCLLFDEYANLNTLQINITLDYDIIYSNADYVSGNVYTWNINRENYKSHGISIIYDTVKDDLSDFDPTNIPEEKENIEETTEKESHILLLLIVMGVFITGLVILIMSKVKKNKDR